LATRVFRLGRGKEFQEPARRVLTSIGDDIGSANGGGRLGRLEAAKPT
jgi:hypothetical protein